MFCKTAIMIDIVCLCIRVAKFVVHVHNVNDKSWSLCYTTLHDLDERLQWGGGATLISISRNPTLRELTAVQTTYNAQC